MQKRCNSIANTLELRLFCIKYAKYCIYVSRWMYFYSTCHIFSWLCPTEFVWPYPVWHETLLSLYFSIHAMFPSLQHDLFWNWVLCPIKWGWHVIFANAIDIQAKTLLFSSQFPDSKVHVTNMGPTWVLSAPGGSHVGPMNFAIRVYMTSALWHRPVPAATSWCYEPLLFQWMHEDLRGTPSNGVTVTSTLRWASCGPVLWTAGRPAKGCGYCNYQLCNFMTMANCELINFGVRFQYNLFYLCA